MECTYARVQVTWGAGAHASGKLKYSTSPASERISTSTYVYDISYFIISTHT